MTTALVQPRDWQDAMSIRRWLETNGCPVGCFVNRPTDSALPSAFEIPVDVHSRLMAWLYQPEKTAEVEAVADAPPPALTQSVAKEATVPSDPYAGASVVEAQAPKRKAAATRK